MVLALIVGLLVYWVVLNSAHESMRAQARDNTERLARQTAHALSLHFNTTATKLDHFTRHLGMLWVQGDIRGFDEGVDVTMTTLPQGAVAQISITDAEGQIQYSRLAGQPAVHPPSPPVSIADRTHFQVHAEEDHSSLYISEPVKGRISQQWTIQFTRGLFKDGVFKGVIVLSVSAEHLAAALKVIFPDPIDAGSLISDTGTYLARSYYLADVLGKKLPDSRPFLQHPDVISGSYEITADVDQVPRLYSWHRVGNFPLIVVVGQSTEKALALTNAAISHSQWRSALASGLLLIAALVVAALWTKRQQTAVALRDSETRLRVTLDAVRDGLWQYDLTLDQAQWDDRILSMLKYDERYASPTKQLLEQLVHPEDLQRIAEEILPLFSQQTNDGMHLDFRIRTGTGAWLWVQARGNVVEWSADGKPLRLMGTLSDIGERLAESKLRDALLSRSAAAILLTSPDRKVIYANKQFASIFLPPGKQPTELDTSELHVSAEHYTAFAALYQSLQTRGSVRAEYPFRDANGGVRWFDVHGLLQDPDDPESNIIWTWVDITSRHKAMKALSVETLRLTALLENFPGGVLIEDAYEKVAFVNNLWPALLGLPLNASQLQGVNDSQLRELIGPQVSSWLHPDSSSSSGRARLLREVVTPQGRYLEIEHVNIVQDAKPLGSLWLVHDITDRKQRELDLTHLASTDALTNLPNRRSFMQNFHLQHDQARLKHQDLGMVMMLDIDRFKLVNDTYGHVVGDIVLQEVARILRDTIRTTDTPARLGGEEFAVLLPRSDVATGTAIAERIRTRIEESPINADEHTIPITISVGVASVGAESTPEIALKQADEALYHAKQTGRNRVCLYASAQAPDHATT